MRHELIDTALGNTAADLVVERSQLLDVYTGEILEETDVAVKGKRIALVGDAEHCVGENTEIVDARGIFLTPGLLDAHVHVESSMVTVTRFAELVLPKGTTGAFIDPHEIANVLGVRGVKLMYEEAKNIPLKVFFEIPSSVPSAPALETTGAEIGWRDVEELLGLNDVVGLGEVMNYLGVLIKDEKLDREIEAAIVQGKVVEGHAPSLLGKELNAYTAAGVMSDHEASTPEEALQRLRLGMRLQIREGSTSKDLATLIRPILRLGLDTRRCLLATDDRNSLDLLEEGHMDFVVRRAVEEGVDPVQAVQMATLNTAEYFGVDRDVGSISPGRFADILLVESLEDFRAKVVIIDGVPIASNGRLLRGLETPQYPRFAKDTMNLREVKPEDLEIRTPLDAQRVKVRVIGIVKDQILTEHRTLWLDVEEGLLKGNPKKDLSKVVVADRHSGTGNIGLGFVQGFGLETGAMASSVSHDAHNVTAVGMRDVDIALAINSVKRADGGLVAVKDGRVLELLELPIAGLMSDKPIWEVSHRLSGLRQAARSLQVEIDSPFMILSFLSLAVVPELRITDRGLVDVKEYSFVDIVVG
ncbi:MAG: adenine deaminase [Nitrososphaeria archaeon]|nr:adenine deaminase [Nitrososphaeria archaeon]NIN51707.1 adenine deaminase [Nitrososphaeria archaeon]NIQ32201.1 adenine deaminase [Nitrososphaeria archaeon]